MVPPIAYITDVEGMWSKLEAFARDNPHVRLDGGRLVVSPGALLVFGGDAIDRGPHGRRIVATLLEAKLRQSEQVILLAGNRDLNKLRLTRELSGHPPHKMPDPVRASSRPEQLRWIFSHTMGAQAAFEHRRAELQEEARAFDDEAVVVSFVEDVREGGALRRYLERCQLAFRAGPTLFVHGGVTEESLYVVPGREPVADPDRWVEALNGWYREQLATVGSGALDAQGRPVWMQLMAYQAPVPGTRENRRSIVYGRTADAWNNPVLPSRAVRERLLSDGVQRVVVGHTPSGDVPSVLRADGFELVIADNSHARVPEGSKVTLDGPLLSVDGYTVLDDGARHRVRYSVTLDEPTPVGRRVRTTGELVKGPLDSGELVTFRYLPEYRCVQRLIAPHEAAEHLLEAPE